MLQNGVITEDGVTRKATPEEQAEMEAKGKQVMERMHQFFQQLIPNFNDTAFPPFLPPPPPFIGGPGPMVGGGPMDGGPRSFGIWGMPPPPPPGPSIGGESSSGEEETGPPLDLSTTPSSIGH